MDWSAPNLAETKPNTSTTSSPPRSTSVTQLDPKVRYQLSRLDKSVPFNPIRRYLHHTWAQTFYSRPEFYFQPSSVPELQKIVTIARRCRKRLCVTGYGHSPSDLTCTSSWLINLDNLNRILETDVDQQKGLVRFEAGISLHDLNESLAKRGYTLPNLGSIDVQSLAGAISTGTHGSSIHHGILSQSITGLTVLLSNSQLVSCSASKNPDLFRAALCSLGSLGIIVEMTFQAVPDFKISWVQSLHSLDYVLEKWDTTLWTTREYTRVWWLPYLKRAVIWQAERTEEDIRPPNTGFYGGALGYYIYHNLLALSNIFPRILPFIEWFVFGMQYGFQPGQYEVTAVEPTRNGLLMNCLYSQFVNEWALPLAKGPEAITRLSAWINHDDETAKIPVSSKGVWVHCPVEVRVTDTNTKNNKSGVKPYLDPTCSDGPTLYLNATLYRPYGKDPPCHEKYYEAFEYLMRELGAKPHWAKNFAYTDREYIEEAYGPAMKDFMRVRNESDPDGMWLGEWHIRNLPIDEGMASEDGPRKSMIEGEVRRKPMGLGWGDGLLWEGARIFDGDESVYTDEEFEDDGKDVKGGSSTSTFEMTSRASEESFDLMAKGEASMYAGKY